MAESSTGHETGSDRSFVSRIGDDFTTTTWVLIPIGIGLNAVGGFIVNLLKLPLFMDNIGTVLLAIMAGPWAAALTGALSNFVSAMLGSPQQLAFLPVPVAIGLVAGVLARRGWFDDVKRVLVSALVIWIVATLIATPIVVVVFGGVTGAGPSLVTGVLVASGRALVESALTAQFLVEFFDKGATTFIAYFIGKAVPPRYLPPQGQQIYSSQK
ncbi:ECF transporter S component [Halegenticoccus soli]|uniref:ECF transporter S component n=1 Tax=Halegenticoccus soli TaxID=1985678 RepID=UPI000C6EA798|nr:ECF transporter S component [Halegenticoccus soli]